MARLVGKTAIVTGLALASDVHWKAWQRQGVTENEWRAVNRLLIVGFGLPIVSALELLGAVLAAVVGEGVAE
jgi:hypothetical protein